VSGVHNVLNSLSVVAAAADRGLGPDAIRAGMEGFGGVRRRLESRGEFDGVLVLDDFAHHPTAILNTLQAVRRRYPQRRLWVVLEPRSWSMRRNVFQKRLGESFDDADRVIIAGVYGADALPEDERLDPHRLVAELSARGSQAQHVPAVDEITNLLAEEAEPGDVIVVMSNGGFDGLIDRLVSRLQTRQARAC
jgi:UDP-N-acetylmuramate: L-alanyl-gamma-D-glutamyl-meso-diaminopimelate ligase